LVHLFACPPFFSARVPRAQPDIVIIKESPTGGLGVFVVRDIENGEFLFAEQSLLVSPAATTFVTHGGEWVHDYTYEDHIKIMRFEREQ
jgi:hypothetical protein